MLVTIGGTPISINISAIVSALELACSVEECNNFANEWYYINIKES